MSGFRLHDWNDVRLIIACADLGSFARAAVALGIDQTTVSRRINAMEEALGRPLFTRRRSGATPTAVGYAMLERARQMEALAGQFEEAMRGLTVLPSPKVTVAASEGLLTYTLIPALLGQKSLELPLDRRLIRDSLPELAFTTALGKADISVVATSPGDLPQVKGAVRVRRVGMMHFRPVAARGFLATQPAINTFDALSGQPLLDIGIYRAIRALDGWNAMVAGRDAGDVLVVKTTPRLHQPLLGGRGVALLPDYASLSEPNLAPLDLVPPRMGVSLWLVSHEDNLREPAVRGLYDLLATMFSTSTWYRER